jgi:anaerobic selenocysteine-containing dehydrogenase
MLKVGFWEVPPSPWPPIEAKKPEKFGMEDIVPTAGLSPIVSWGINEPEKHKIPYKPEFMMQVGGNPLMSIADPREWEKVLQKVFVVNFNIFLDETAEFADIVLPDACYLERLDAKADWISSFSPVDEWAFHLRQPVVEPLYQHRPSQEVLLQLAERLDILSKMNFMINIKCELADPYKLDPAKKYSWEEIVDRRFKGYFGPEHGLVWFKENGLIHWPKKVEEVYWRPFVKGRAPLYFEYFQTVGKQIEKIKKEHDIPGFDTADFQPVPDWKPSAPHNEKRPEFDLYSIYYRTSLQTCTYTTNNPWLDEVSRMEPSLYNIILNSETAKKKGIKNGDRVIIESGGTGYKAEGIATVTEGIHPEVIAYNGGGGHWAKRLPIASQPNKGICAEWLIPLSWDYIDTVSFNLELCVKVKVTKKV